MDVADVESLDSKNAVPSIDVGGDMCTSRGPSTIVDGQLRCRGNDASGNEASVLMYTIGTSGIIWQAA